MPALVNYRGMLPAFFLFSSYLFIYLFWFWEWVDLVKARFFFALHVRFDRVLLLVGWSLDYCGVDFFFFFFVSSVCFDGYGCWM